MSTRQPAPASMKRSTSARMIAAPSGESYMRADMSSIERKPSSAMPSISGAPGVSGATTTFCT